MSFLRSKIPITLSALATVGTVFLSATPARAEEPNFVAPIKFDSSDQLQMSHPTQAKPQQIPEPGLTGALGLTGAIAILGRLRKNRS
jgi:hypothetical protein